MISRSIISAAATALVATVGFGAYSATQKAELARVEAQSAAYQAEARQLNDAAVSMQTACENFSAAIAKVQGPHDPTIKPVGGGS